MKKFFSACAALLLGVMLFAFAGCGGKGSKVFKYLKTEQNFVGNPTYNGGKYTASFTVNDDLSYSLSVADEYDSALKDYSTEGSKMEYLGRLKKNYESTSWGITTHWKIYMHVIKLPEATVESNGKTLAFFLLAESDSKYGDIDMLKLVVKPAEYGEDDVGNFEISVYGGYALKKA